MEQALAKIHDEMEKNKDNEYIQCIGAYLADYLRSNLGAAANIMAEGKTIAGSLAAMRETATRGNGGIDAIKRNAKNNVGMAVLTPAEGYKAVLDYYGIQGAQPAAVQPKPQRSAKPSFNVSLTDLLE